MQAWIHDAVRTPRGKGKKDGSLHEITALSLASQVLEAIRDRNNLDTSTVDDVIWSTSSQNGKQGGDLGRMAALAAGYDIGASGMTLDRYCGSGITAVNLAAAVVGSGSEDLVIAGGTEMMSTYGNPGMRNSPFMDNDNLRLREIHPQPHQGICADAIATLEGISRQALDEVGLVSQQRAGRAIARAVSARA